MESPVTRPPTRRKTSSKATPRRATTRQQQGILGGEHSAITGVGVGVGVGVGSQQTHAPRHVAHQRQRLGAVAGLRVGHAQTDRRDRLVCMEQQRLGYMKDQLGDNPTAINESSIAITS